VESGEGIERLSPDDIDVSAHLWNPVKELKAYTPSCAIVVSNCRWNPVKELKDPFHVDELQPARFFSGIR